ncbi:LysR family transcriptional regulator [Sodalis sp. RH24]|uniref:LysR family transcriptional regulator n=1 Tax=unclassified Sodalis (in: enterobacteria) TaxID=2636512 RepID=UPI0039B4C559
MDFHGIDLNLLAAFDALMDERNVTRAAARVGVSQPAMSAALSRLRALFGDPLFLRSAEGLLPTPRARDIAQPIAQALRQIEAALVAKPAFMPAKASLAFTLGVPDYPAFVLLAALVTALEKQAPGVSLNVRAFTGRDSAVDLLDAGTIDVAVGVMPTRPETRIMTRPILRDEFVTITRRAGAAVEDAMTLARFLALRHVLASPEDDRHGLVDQALAQMGKQRILALTLPQMFAVPGVVARTALTATLLRRVVLNSPVRHELALFAPPVVLPPIEFHLIWHRKSDQHPAQRWFRELIASHALALQ